LKACLTFSLIGLSVNEIQRAKLDRAIEVACY
jgi:hypothetical protein